MSAHWTFGVGLAKQIKEAAEKAGVSTADLERLACSDVFKQILPVLRGMGKVVIQEHFIDCKVVSADKLTFDVSLAEAIERMAKYIGATKGDLLKLYDQRIFRQILPILRGMGEVVAQEHFIDCDVDPEPHCFGKVEKHRKGGLLRWDPERIKLYLADGQRSSESVRGTELRKQLKPFPVLNANALDYLLDHKELIPEAWKYTAGVYFWGTIYQGDKKSFYEHCPSDALFIRCLCWDPSTGGWRDGFSWIDEFWTHSCPAALDVIDPTDIIFRYLSGGGEFIDPSIW